jgi:hypothetical protein
LLAAARQEYDGDSDDDLLVYGEIDDAGRLDLSPFTRRELEAGGGPE